MKFGTFPAFDAPDVEKYAYSNMLCLMGQVKPIAVVSISSS
jgi:hypothetical protein